MRGIVRVPGDRAATQLALLLASLATGETVLEHVATGTDIAALIRLLGQLGIGVALSGTTARISGLGIGGFLTPDGPLDFSDVGEASALLIGLLSAHDFVSTITGFAATQLSEALLAFLSRSGTAIERSGTDLKIRPPRFSIPLDLALPEGALVLKQPLLLHALATVGTSVFHLPPSPDDALEAVLTAFGAHLRSEPTDDGIKLSIDGLAPLTAATYVVAGDPMLAAYVAVAAIIAPDSEITIEAMSLSPSRMALLDALREFGAKLRFEPAKDGRRDATDLVVEHVKLTGLALRANAAIEQDDFAILAVAASYARGDTLLAGLGNGYRRLALSRALRANGVECEEREAGLLIHGMNRVPGGGKVTAKADPKLAMAFTVLGMGADKPVTVDDQAPILDMFPGLLPQLEHLGAGIAMGKPK
ncbi:MAG: hypothetical protein ABI697_00365 [Devosia sp.]